MCFQQFTIIYDQAECQSCSMKECFFRKEGGQRRNDLIDLMIDAMEDTLEHDDGQDEGQFDNDSKLNHR